ncbi:MAG: hypothetical protein E6J88_03250, partial [Deltaproteobacteria bacterium]
MGGLGGSELPPSGGAAGAGSARAARGHARQFTRAADMTSDLKTLAVVGAGQMGAGIAQVAAQSG